MNNTKLVLVVDNTKRCQSDSCGNVAQVNHTCPIDREIYWDRRDHVLCNCCEECEQYCEAEIDGI